MKTPALRTSDWQLLLKAGAARAAVEPAPMLRGSEWARQPTQVFRLGRLSAATEWYIQCELYGLSALRDAVDIDPDRRGGVPVLKGTGFTVSQALAELADGAGVSELAENFDLDPEGIKRMLHGLSLMLQRPFAE